jgi:hypothetical protein
MATARLSADDVRDAYSLILGRLPESDAIIEAHRGLADEQSAALNAALVLILANQIGDQEVLADALALARAAITRPAGQAGN